MLTYKSIQWEVQQRCRGTPPDLRECYPNKKGRGRRFFYTTPEIDDLLHVGPKAASEQKAWAELAADLTDFLAGQEIAVRKDGSTDDGDEDSFFARLRPPHSEIWEIRSNRKQPAIRLFGRFAWRDAFVCLAWRYRRKLQMEGFDPAMIECKQAWDRLFSDDPLSGGRHPDDYISHTRIVFRR